MGSPFVVDGNKVIFEPAFGVAKVAVSPGWVQASQDAFTVNGKSVAVLGDQASVEVRNCVYSTSTHTISGRGTLYIERLCRDQQSTIATVAGQHALLIGTVMQARFQVDPKQPAKAPGTPPIPDPIPIYYGTARFVPEQTQAVASVGGGGSAGHAVATHDPAREKTGSPTRMLRLKVQDRFGPAIEERFSAILPDVPKPVEGTTDEQGVLSIAVPQGTTNASIEIGEGVRRCRIHVSFGNLKEINTTEGQWQRLKHLGYASTRSLGRSIGAKALEPAIQSFQMAQSMTPTGHCSAEVVNALKENHGC